jgi:hypothetical protein
LIYVCDFYRCLTTGAEVRGVLRQNSRHPKRMQPSSSSCDSRLEGGVNRAKLKFTNINTTTSRVSVRNRNESAREGEKQISSK